MALEKKGADAKKIAQAYLTISESGKIKTPEQRYLVLAALGAVMGAVSTAWRDHVRAQREECRGCAEIE